MSFPRILSAAIFATIGAGAQALFELALVRPLFGLSETAALAFAIGGGIAAGCFGFFTGLKGVYSLDARAIWAFVLDVSWSALNTITGLVWLIWCAAKGAFQQPNVATRKRGIIVFRGPTLPGADATTIGTIVGGRWLLHEAVHVQQARIFGPYYWPLYLLGYGVNFLVLVLTGRPRDAHWEAYRRVVLEDWAYRAAPRDQAPSVDPKQTVRWLLAALLNAVGVVILLGPVPIFGTLAGVVGLAELPWWCGAIILVAYAIVRSVFSGSTWTTQTSIP